MTDQPNQPSILDRAVEYNARADRDAQESTFLAQWARRSEQPTSDQKPDQTPAARQFVADAIQTGNSGRSMKIRARILRDDREVVFMSKEGEEGQNGKGFLYCITWTLTPNGTAKRYVMNAATNWTDVLDTAFDRSGQPIFIVANDQHVKRIS